MGEREGGMNWESSIETYTVSKIRPRVGDLILLTNLAGFLLWNQQANDRAQGLSLVGKRTQRSMIQGVFVNICFLECLISHCDVSQFFPHGKNVNSTFRKKFPLDALQFPFLLLFLCSALSSPHPITSCPPTSQTCALLPTPLAPHTHFPFLTHL